nr:hypothetical protein [Streptomyces sp. SID5468]
MDTGEAHRPYAAKRYGRFTAPAPGTTTVPAAPDGEAGVDCWDLVTVPSRQGLEAVDILRLRTGVGPVLHDHTGDTLGFLVPPGTADCWDLPGSACTGTDGRARRWTDDPPVAGAGWLVRPEDGHQVTDPAQLRQALGEAARTLEAADQL